MAIKKINPNTTLQKQLELFKRQSKVPAEVRELMQRETATLIRSGIAEHVLQEGARAPDFALPNAFGETVTLTDLLAHGPVVVIFYRGEWCPFCNLTLRAYQAILPQIRDLGASLVAISPQTPDKTLLTVENKGLTFEVLSDVGNKVAGKYGLVFALSDALRPIYHSLGLDLPAYNGDDSWELPMPGMFVIVQDGTVQLAFVDADYTHRLEPEAILVALHKIVGR